MTGLPRIVDLMRLDGRVALVTGGAGHIGAAVAETLAELGASVAVLDFSRETCEQRSADLERQFGVRAVPMAVDLEDEGALRASVRSVVETMGRLDVVVHSAAWAGTTDVAGWATPFETQTVAAWDRALRVNLTAAFVLVQEARLALAGSGHGSVVLIGSIYGSLGPDMSLYEGTTMANPAGYGASKGGLLQLTRYLSTVLAPSIRVNAVSPGGVWRGQPETFHDRYRRRTPLGRMATEADVKGAVAYLAGDLSTYVTGHNLVVDGGWSAW